MVRLLLGEAGSGKTKKMISKANEMITGTKGELVYIEPTGKHATQLHRNIRCVFTEDYSLNSFASIYGFLCGLTSANHDIESIFIDGLDQILHSDINEVAYEFMKLVKDFAEKNSVNVYISGSVHSPEIISGLKEHALEF
ncbi:MAG: hypothetical protein ACRC76_09860 [Proteocatella sp.]